ncbi:Excinuclease ABC, B subunit, partial [mine drainage metagenome]
RREKQLAYNAAHGITPETVRKSISHVLASVYEEDYATVPVDAQGTRLVGKDLKAYKASVEKRMLEAASNLEFEEAARLRDELHNLDASELGISRRGQSQQGRPSPRKGRKRR